MMKVREYWYDGAESAIRFEGSYMECIAFIAENALGGTVESYGEFGAEIVDTDGMVLGRF